MRLLFLLLSLSATPVWATCEKCNVVLISLDTVGIRPLGMYGAKPSATPNLDAFAKNNRVYLNAYTPAPWTLPAHAAMMTGQYPWVMRVNGQADQIPAEYPTLAEILKKQGYSTVGITDGLFVDEAHGFARGFDQFQAAPNKTFVFADKKMRKTIPDAITRIANRSKKKPFFLFYHTYDAHEPLLPSVESVKALLPQATKFQADMAEIAKISKQTTPVEPTLARDLKVLYAASIMDVDRNLGLLLQSLEHEGLLNNTIVIVTADHGQEMGEHGSWALHGFQLWDEVMRVPLIVHIPGVPAKVLNAPVSLVDIAPSILAWIGIKTADKFMGEQLPEVNSEKDFDRAIFGYSTATRDQLIHFATKPPDGRPAPKSDSIAEKPQAVRRMVLVNHKKYILDVFAHKQTVFDLVNDPDEKNEQAVNCQELLCRAQENWIFNGGF